MKKILLVFSMTFMLILSGCGAKQPSPTDVTNSFLEAIKIQDEDTMKTVYAGDSDFSFAKEALEDASDDNELLGDYLDDYIKKLLDFDYEVSNEQITDDKAKVNVTISTYEFGAKLEDYFDDYVKKLTAAYSDGDYSDKTNKSILNDLAKEMLNKLSDKSYKKTVSLSLTKDDDGWKVDKIDEDSDFIKALCGGLFESLEKIQNKLDD